MKSMSYFALVHYPTDIPAEMREFRRKYDPFFSLIPEHVTFVFPVPKEIGRRNADRHIDHVLARWEPFRVHFCTLELSWDHWLYLGAREGHGEVVDLHDQLYEGLLRPHLRVDLPFYPHIGLAPFGTRPYDFDDPTAEMALDQTRYRSARNEFEKLGVDLWCTVDRLTLVGIDAGFTRTENLREFRLES